MKIKGEIRHFLIGAVVILAFLSLVSLARADSRPKFPAHIKVGPYTYSMQYVSDKEAGNLLGSASPDALEIVILKGMPLERERQVVLHEVIHAAVDVGYRGKLDCISDELFLAASVPTLLEVLRENPELSAYLLAK